MYFIKNFIKVFYFTIWIFLGLNLFFSSIFWYKISPIFILFYIVFVIPILEKIYSYIFFESRFNLNLKFRWLNVLKYLIIILLFIFILNTSLTFLNIFFILLWVFSILFLLDSRFIYYIALVLLIFVVGFIIIDNKFVAEKLSIISYYYLVLWVLISIYENFRLDNQEKNEI